MFRAQATAALLCRRFRVSVGCDRDVTTILAAVDFRRTSPAPVEQRSDSGHARCWRRILGAGDACQDLDAHFGVSTRQRAQKNWAEFSFGAMACGVGLPPPVGGVRRGDNHGNNIAQKARTRLGGRPHMIQINAAVMARWADGSSCMYARPTDTRPRHGQLRDRPCPSSVQRHPIVCPGLHDVARMERQQGRCAGWGGGT